MKKKRTNPRPNRGEAFRPQLYLYGNDIEDYDLLKAHLSHQKNGPKNMSEWFGEAMRTKVQEVLDSIEV